MLTWQESYTKCQRLAKDNNASTLVQLKQDMNTGYQLFNARLSRYFSRKQQFTDLVEGQSIYQTPIDCVRVMGMTVSVSSSYQITVKEIRSEYQWRQTISYKSESNWPVYYFMIGNDSLELWPTPSQDVVNGLRFYYQPQDFFMSIDDVTSDSTSATVSVENGDTTVTASSGVFDSGMAGLYFQLTGVTDLTWYEIVSATSNTLTLKSAFVAPSVTGASWRVGQSFIIPQEYHDAPMHYALSNFFSAQGNETRANFHKTEYKSMVEMCKEEYSSSNESNVITIDDTLLNPWLFVPLPSTD